MQHILTSSFFNKNQNLYRTIESIEKLIELDANLPSYAFSSKSSHRVEIASEVLNVFSKSSHDDCGVHCIDHLQILCKCKSLIESIRGLSNDEAANDKQQKKKMLYYAINNTEGDLNFVFSNTHRSYTLLFIMKI